MKRIYKQKMIFSLRLAMLKITLSDYHIKNENFFFIFGIPNKDKAQLITIILERILRKQIEENFEFDSLIVLENIENILRNH